LNAQCWLFTATAQDQQSILLTLMAGWWVFSALFKSPALSLGSTW
jgi:hypothetical protein